MELKIASLTSGYGRVQIVNNVSLAVRPAEITAVIGRNGVGKTTLIKTIIGALPAASGSISFGAADVTRLGPAERARLGIGYVPQGRGIFTRMTVAANLALGAGVGRAASPDLERALAFFPILGKRLSQLAGSMSGGEQQQLAIGRILAGRPGIMLLDEPSEGIQPSIVQEIGLIVRRLRDEVGLAIMIVEQNLALIQAVADTCLVMDKGAIIARIAPGELSDPDVAQRYLAI
ncbi:ABC transporter ATP-binding protein [Chelatococcus reniformis]|uniref:ABC transporter ATP-binding protein n=1 Tax=Chelatococcus reniformis TaxID=1494448 RepID=A0A916U490_9HYPH|nr:ABC transporter ATP-binding protein [Chelatococcus reniformis]GGC59049.1 ABC transporter ATP-binding protein [Chelatococcus reniformis]